MLICTATKAPNALGNVFALAQTMRIAPSIFLATVAIAGVHAADSKALWQDPTDIQSRDLFYGSGGKEHEPKGTFTFVKEDMDGTNPKFDVKSSDGTKWKVKMGVEAKPEVAAARLIWAVGYHTNDDYFLPVLQAEDMKLPLKRGQSEVQSDGSVRNVRLKRQEAKKSGTWKWKDNPFKDTKEMYGLRVMMALVNNWDLKDANNATYDGGNIYLVSDLGATFGSTNLRVNHEAAKGNIDSYRDSKFIKKATPEYVNFNLATAPSPIYIFNPHEEVTRLNMSWIGKEIPIDAVKWIGQLLAKLSPAQIKDAFRAAGYTPEEGAAFADVVSKRIAEISSL